MRIEMNSDAKPIQLRICLWEQTSTINKSSLVLLSFFTSTWWIISVDMLVISIVERCFWL